VTVDVVCAAPPYLDITFSGMSRFPTLGEERLASAIAFTPGGIANVARGLHRLGLRTVISSQIADDVAGALLRRLLADEGIEWLGASGGATSVSAVLPVDGDRGFATFGGESKIDREAIAALDPQAVVIDLDVAEHAPPGVPTFAVVGDAEAQAIGRRLPEATSGLRALIANQSEACHLTGEANAAEGARKLAREGAEAVVTLGAAGALWSDGRAVEHARAPEYDAVDTSGAGDLFAAAYVWADLRGDPPAERLRLATTYASLSVRVPTPAAGALDLDEFLAIAGPPIEERSPQ
jgi:sugar/nucleoside kinase (ribokinase family)